MGSKRVSAFALTLLLAFTVVTGPLFAANPGYDKGFATAKTLVYEPARKRASTMATKKVLKKAR